MRVEEFLIERNGFASVEQLETDSKARGFGENAVKRYMHHNPSRQQAVDTGSKKTRVIYAKDFEEKYRKEMIGQSTAASSCFRGQEVYPTICRDYCIRYSKCYGGEGSLRLVLNGRGITLESQSHQDPRTASSGSTEPRWRTAMRRTRPDSSSAPYSGQE